MIFESHLMLIFVKLLEDLMGNRKIWLDFGFVGCGYLGLDILGLYTLGLAYVTPLFSSYSI